MFSIKKQKGWYWGIFLLWTTVLMWGLLPITTDILLKQKMNSFTIVWYRFAGGLIFLLFYLRFSISKKLKFNVSLKMLVCLLFTGICASFTLLFFTIGLEYIPAGSGELIASLGPIFLIMGGLLVFKEKLKRVQKKGVVFVIIGLLLFFNAHYSDFNLYFESKYFFGAIIMTGGALCWAIYMLFQKKLINAEVPIPTILLLAWCIGVLCVMPFAHIGQILNLDIVGFIAILVCIITTVLPFFCLAEATKHVKITLIGALTSLTPLITMIIVLLWVDTRLRFNPEHYNLLSVIGSFIIIFGIFSCSKK